MAKDTVEVLIEGGTATPGPPLGPALGPLGINMMQVVDEINNKTAMDIPTNDRYILLNSLSYFS